MKRTFTVEIREDCKVCGEKIPEKQGRGGYRTYCSKKCRGKALYHRHFEYHMKWQRERWGRFSYGKKRCLICKKWYVMVGGHAWQRHGLTAREYREKFGLPLKKGILPKWYKEMKGKQALENGTWQNLRIGKKYWYKKGDERAIVVTGWKGRNDYQTSDYR